MFVSCKNSISRVFEAAISKLPKETSSNTNSAMYWPSCASSVLPAKLTAAPLSLILMISAKLASLVLPTFNINSAFSALLAVNLIVSLSPTPKPPINVSAGSSVC